MTELKLVSKMSRLGNTPASTLDRIYRNMIGGGVFPGGWGDPGRINDLLEFHKIMSNRLKVQSLVERDPAISVDVGKDLNKCIVYNGEFFSPFAKHFPGLLPEASETCKFQLIVPKQWESEDRPIALHMAGTGDQYFWRRRNFIGWPLATENGIGSLIIENPFYGTRRPPNQIRSNVRFVSDIFVMGGGLMLESLTLLNWLEKMEYGPFCMTGISMGGHMASLCATNCDRPIGIAPCLSWATASPVFTRGVMTNAINWKNCDSQFMKEEKFQTEVWDRLIHYDLLRPEAEHKSLKKEKRTKILATNEKSNKKKFFRVMEDLRLNRLLSSFSGFLTFLPNFSILNLVNGKTISFSSLSLLFSFINKQKRQSIENDNLNFEGRNSSRNKNKNKANEPKLADFYAMEDTEERRKSLEFMRRLMDHFTHLSNFEKPIDPELAIFISARNDAYVLRDGVARMEDIWPGCTVKYVDAGHVMAYVIYQNQFRQAISDSVTKHRSKYNRDGTIRPSYALSHQPPVPKVCPHIVIGPNNENDNHKDTFSTSSNPKRGSEIWAQKSHPNIHPENQQNYNENTSNYPQL